MPLNSLRLFLCFCLFSAGSGHAAAALRVEKELIPAPWGSALDGLFRQPGFRSQLEALIPKSDTQRYLDSPHAPRWTVWTMAVAKLPADFADRPDARVFLAAVEDGLSEVQAAAQQAVSPETPTESLPAIIKRLQQPDVVLFNMRQQDMFKFCMFSAAQRYWRERGQALIANEHDMLTRELCWHDRPDRLEMLRADEFLRRRLEDHVLYIPPAALEKRSSFHKLNSTLVLLNPREAAFHKLYCNSRGMNEARTLMHLERAGVTEGIPKVEGVGVDYHGQFWMRLRGIADGFSLSDSSRLITLAERLEEAIKFSLILQKIHDAGFVHNDLKPQHLIVNPAGDALVIDFEHAVREGDSSTTVTPDFTPQETDRRRDSDVYSFGLTLMDLFHEPRLDGLFRSMTEKSREARWPKDMNGVARELDRLRGGSQHEKN